jgi:hypothetical protein
LWNDIMLGVEKKILLIFRRCVDWCIWHIVPFCCYEIKWKENYLGIIIFLPKLNLLIRVVVMSKFFSVLRTEPRALYCTIWAIPQSFCFVVCFWERVSLTLILLLASNSWSSFFHFLSRWDHKCSMPILLWVNYLVK